MECVASGCHKYLVFRGISYVIVVDLSAITGLSMVPSTGEAIKCSYFETAMPLC